MDDFPVRRIFIASVVVLTLLSIWHLTLELRLRYF